MKNRTIGIARHVSIEDIEARRRGRGIDDIELRESVRRLRAGDFVRLTLLSDPEADSGETVLVRITSVRRGGFQRRLAMRPAQAGLAQLPPGTLLAFLSSHVHSLPAQRAPHGR